MPIEKDSEVKNYINYLKAYLEGDLESFHQGCVACEQKEAADSSSSSVPPTHSHGSMWHPALPTTVPTSTSTTTEQTRFPNQGPAIPGIPKYFRSTIPHTLSIYSAMDTVGFLMRTGGTPNETNKNIKAFLKSERLSAAQLEVLVFLCRHGMSHSYFPKLGIAIEYRTTEMRQEFFYMDVTGVVLNAKRLKDNVLKKLREISNATDFKNMTKQYKKMIDEDKAKWTPAYSELVKELKKK